MEQGRLELVFYQESDFMDEYAFNLIQVLSTK